MTPFSCRNQTRITQTQTLSWAFQYCLFLTEPVIEEQISSRYSCISASKLTQIFFSFLFQTWKVYHSIPYKVWMTAEGRSSSILTDIRISGDNCHLFWPFAHAVLNNFINDWRISQSKDREIVRSKHQLLLSSWPEMHGPGGPHPGQLCTSWPPNFLFSRSWSSSFGDCQQLCSFFMLFSLCPESSLFMTQEQQLPPILCAFPPHC